MLKVKAEKSPGATALLACVAYAVGEIHPLAQAACGEVMLQVSLSAPHTAKFTWLAVLATHADVPVFAKNTENVPTSPEFRLKKALSNWYAESNAVAARAVVP